MRPEKSPVTTVPYRNLVLKTEHTVSLWVSCLYLLTPPPLLRAHTHTLGELDCGQTWDSSAWDRTQRAGVIHRERGIPELHRRQSTARSW